MDVLERVHKHSLPTALVSHLELRTTTNIIINDCFICLQGV